MDNQNYKNLETQLLEFETKLKDVMNDINLEEFSRQNKIIRLLQEYSMEEYKSNPILQSKILDIFNELFKKKLETNNNLDSLTKDIKKIKEDEVLKQQKKNQENNENSDNDLIDLNLDDILLKTKDTILEVLDEFLENKLSLKDLIKDNRGFYIGVSLILTLFFLYFFYILITDDNYSSKSGGGIHINYNN